MKHKIIQSFSGLKIKDNVNPISIMNNMRIKTGKRPLVHYFGNLFDEDKHVGAFALNVGSQNIQILLQNPYIIQEMEGEEGDQHSITPCMQYLSDCLQSFLFCLWLIKDNAVNMNDTYCYSEYKTTKHVFTRNTRQLLLTKSDGASALTEFTKAEIIKAVSYYTLYFDNPDFGPRPSYSLNDRTEIDETAISQVPPIGNEFDSTVQVSVTPAYQRNIESELTRFERARSFINAARTQSNPIMKITYYCSFLEVLFSGNSTEVTYRIRERTSLTIGQSFEERKDIFKMVAKVYDIRSKFIHGAKFDKKLTAEKIEDYSKYMDKLCRNIFFELLENHKELFEFKNDSDLDNFFIELMFKMNNTN